jgi:hypothetical protein
MPNEASVRKRILILGLPQKAAAGQIGVDAAIDALLLRQKR